MTKRIEFTAKIRDKAADRACGKCQKCGLPFGGKKMHFDHILPLALNGESTLANCQVLCEPCHNEKTAKEDVPRIRKADRSRRAARGIKNANGPKIKSPGFPLKQEKPGKIDKSKLQPLPRRNILTREIIR